MGLTNHIPSGCTDGGGDRFEQTQEIKCPEQLFAQPATEARSTRPILGLHEGQLLSGRYRVLYHIAGGWLAFDERLTRPVFVAAIVAEGESPAERIRREAARGAPLVDAIIAGEAAFAIRILSYSA